MRAVKPNFWNKASHEGKLSGLRDMVHMANMQVRKNNFIAYSRNGRPNKKNLLKLLKNQYIGLMTGKYVLKCPKSMCIKSSDQNYILQPNHRKIGVL